MMQNRNKGRDEKMEHPSLVVKSEIYNEMMDTAIKLVRKIQAKQGIETETITQEEADFANAFMTYASEIMKVIGED